MCSYFSSCLLNFWLAAIPIENTWHSIPTTTVLPFALINRALQTTELKSSWQSPSCLFLGILPQGFRLCTAAYLCLSVASTVSVSRHSHLTNTNTHGWKAWRLEQKLPTFFFTMQQSSLPHSWSSSIKSWSLSGGPCQLEFKRKCEIESPCFHIRGHFGNTEYPNAADLVWYHRCFCGVNGCRETQWLLLGLRTVMAAWPFSTTLQTRPTC